MKQTQVLVIVILVLVITLQILGVKFYQNEQELKQIKQNPYHWVETNIVDYWGIHVKKKRKDDFFEKFYGLNFPMVIKNKVYRKIDLENYWRCLYFPTYTEFEKNYICGNSIYKDNPQRIVRDRKKIDEAITYLVKDSLNRGVYYTTTYYQFLSVISYSFLIDTNPKILLRRFEKKSSYLPKLLEDPTVDFKFPWIIENQLRDIRYVLKQYNCYGDDRQMYKEMLSYAKIVYLNR